MAWIFRYVRGDRVNVDMGEVRGDNEVPFKSKNACKEASDQNSGFGAICSAPIEVPDNYVLQKHDDGHY